MAKKKNGIFAKVGGAIAANMQAKRDRKEKRLDAKIERKQSRIDNKLSIKEQRLDKRERVQMERIDKGVDFGSAWIKTAPQIADTIGKTATAFSTNKMLGGVLGADKEAPYSGDAEQKLKQLGFDTSDMQNAMEGGTPYEGNDEKPDGMTKVWDWIKKNWYVPVGVGLGLLAWAAGWFGGKKKGKKGGW